MNEGRVTDLDLDDELPFGKYAGKTVRYVLGNDFQYLLWFAENVQTYQLADEPYRALYDQNLRNEII